MNGTNESLPRVSFDLKETHHDSFLLTGCSFPAKITRVKTPKTLEIVDIHGNTCTHFSAVLSNDLWNLKKPP